MTSAMPHADRPYGEPPSGYRLPDATRVGAVRLLVSDLARSLAWYEAVLGLHAIARTPETAALGPVDDDRVLVRLETRSGTRNAQPGAFGLFHFALLVPDRASLGRFAAHLATTGVRPGMADHLVSEALYLHDPDGLGIEVYADRPRDTWRYRGRELAMTTDPLDLRDLVAAGAGRAWSGMPAGTIMGHVHLHVGDLDTADRFYREGLGFDVMARRYPGALFLAAGGYHHHLATNVWARGPAPGPDRARLLAWELVLPSGDDVRAAASHVSASPVVTIDDAGGVAIDDPWGTRVRLSTDAGVQARAGAR